MKWQRYFCGWNELDDEDHGTFVTPRPGGIKRWCCLTSDCLTSVAYIRSAGGVCGRLAGWRVLADRARLGRPGSRLPLRASVPGLGGAYLGGRPPTACLLWHYLCSTAWLQKLLFLFSDYRFFKVSYLLLYKVLFKHLAYPNPNGQSRHCSVSRINY